MIPPLPGLIPNADGTGYTICPKCVKIWGMIGVALLLLYLAYKKGIFKNA